MTQISANLPSVTNPPPQDEAAVDETIAGAPEGEADPAETTAASANGSEPLGRLPAPNGGLNQQVQQYAQLRGQAAVVEARLPANNGGTPTGGATARKSFAEPRGTSVQRGSATANAAAEKTAAAARTFAATVDEVADLGRDIADSKHPASDEDRAAWQDAQARLRDASAAYADAVRALPADAPEREAARLAFGQMNERLAAIELPVLARLDPAMGKSWDQFNSKEAGSEGAVLDQRLKQYGMTRDDLQRYVLTGEEPAALKRALGDAQRRGEWPALGVVRAAYTMRADYLRATASPDDLASHKIAAELSATAGNLSSNRAAIHMAWGTRTAARLLNDKPDPAQRSAHEKRQLDEAKQAIASVRGHAVEQVTKHPERFGKESATRTLAADGLATEAGISQVEAKGQMQREAKELAKGVEAQNASAKPNDPKLVPQPPKLHPDLAEGGLVDRKRNEARTIDPRLADVTHGGDRAVHFARDTLEVKKLRLANGEQQVAHLKSRQQVAEAAHLRASPPPAALVANVNVQREQLFHDSLATHDRLTQQKTGTLSVEQTRLLGELDGDVAHLARGISAVSNEKSLADAEQARVHEESQTAVATRQKVGQVLEELDKNKLARLRSELTSKGPFDPETQAAMLKMAEDPVAYAKAQPDSDQEKQVRAKLLVAQNNLDAAIPRLRTDEAGANDRFAQLRQVDALDGGNTDADNAAGVAKDALAHSAAHLTANPPKGPERVERLQAALDHQNAVTDLAALVRDNADARIGWTQQRDLAVDALYQRETPGAFEDPVGKSRAFTAQVVADETAVKRGALQDAKGAVATSESLREKMSAELARSHAKPSEVAAYKDALAAQLAHAHGTVADIAADLDPSEANAQLDRAAAIIADDLPSVQVARMNTEQAKIDHAHNLVRGEALANLGETGVAVAQRAGTQGGIAYGQLGVEALGSAHRSAMSLDETVTIDGGGAAGATADKARLAELKARSGGILAAEHEMDRNVDADAVADAIDAKLPSDIDQYQRDYAAMAKEIQSRDFGYTINLATEAMAGFGLYDRGANDEAHHVGMQFLDLGTTKGRLDPQNLHQLAEDIRAMRRAGVPSQVIMGALRDPRLAAGASGEQRSQWISEMQDVSKTRFGASVPADLLGVAAAVRTGTPLGRALDGAASNDTRAIVGYIKSPATDLLSDAQASLHKSYADASKDWERFQPYVKLGHVLDQVILTAASSVAFAGVFARVAALTTLPQKFAAAREIAMGFSLPGKIGALAGINVAEAGLGMLTGSAISKVGNGIFGEGTLGAKIFSTVGSGLQLGAGSAVAMRTGIGFQVTLGVTMGATPIVAEELGMSPALAEKLGTAVGIFLPAAIGTIGQLRSMPRAPEVMAHEFGVDPNKARAVSSESFRALSGDALAGGANGQMRERAGRLVDANFKELGADARANLADTLTLDATRARVNIDLPAHGTAANYVREIEGYYKRLETELVKQGVSADRAHELVTAEKTAMYAESLATTNGFLAGAEKPPALPDAHSPGGAGALTRRTAERLGQEVMQPASHRGPGTDPAATTASHARDEIAQIGGIPRDAINAQAMWPSMHTVEERLAFLKLAVNARLQAQGLPEIGLVGLYESAGADGQFTVPQHEVALRQSLLEKPHLTDQDVVALSEVLRHEVEHSTQVADAARVLAAQGADVGTIVFRMGKGTSLQVSERVAKWAVAEQAAGRGIDLASPRAQAAKQIMGSLYEGRRNAAGFTRQQVLDNLEFSEREFYRADAAYKQQKGTAGEASALQERDVAVRYYQEAFSQYHALPEEQGAHVAGHLAKKEAEILTDRTPAGANDFENAPTGVYRTVPTQPEAQPARTAPSRAAEPAHPVTAGPDEPTGRYAAPDVGNQPRSARDVTDPSDPVEVVWTDLRGGTAHTQVMADGTVNITFRDRTSTNTVDEGRVTPTRLMRDLGLQRSEAVALMKEILPFLPPRPKLLISFAQAKSDPRNYALSRLTKPELGWTSDAFDKPPVEGIRNKARDPGDLTTGKLRLSEYAYVFLEGSPDQFQSKPSGTAAGVREYQYHEDPDGPRGGEAMTRPVAVVRVNERGEIAEVAGNAMRGTPAEARTRLLELFQDNGWKVSKDVVWSQ